MNKFWLIFFCGLGLGLLTKPCVAQDTISSSANDSLSVAEKPGYPNLVKNPGFEERKKVVSSLGQIKLASGWRSVSEIEGDLFSSGAKPGDFSAFGNKYGSETPKDGFSYAGFLAYSHQNQVSRSYIYGKLNNSLKKGRMYCATISISLADKSKYALQDIGVYFAEKKVKTEKNEHFIVRPQVLPAVPKWRKKTDGWEYVCNNFIAKGGEDYIVLGNFFSNLETIVKKRDLPEDSLKKYMPIAYYFVDEINVHQVDSSAACNCEVKEEEKYVPKYVFYSKSAISEDSLTLEQKVFSSAVHYLPYESDLSPLELEHDSIYNDVDRLVKLAKLLKANPDMQIKVLGYSDEEEYYWPDSLLTEMVSLEGISGNEDSVLTNMAEKRVRDVIDFLCSEGIREERLIPVVMNHENPIDTARNPIAKAKNRRVEFAIVGLDEMKKQAKLKKFENVMQKSTPPPTFKYIKTDTIVDPKDQD